MSQEISPKMAAIEAFNALQTYFFRLNTLILLAGGSESQDMDAVLFAQCLQTLTAPMEEQFLSLDEALCRL